MVRLYTGISEQTDFFYELRGNSAGLYELVCLDTNTRVMASEDYPHVYASLCALCDIVLLG